MCQQFRHYLTRKKKTLLPSAKLRTCKTYLGTLSLNTQSVRNDYIGYIDISFWRFPLF